jgi:plasmid stabilization system protein ParE
VKIELSEEADEQVREIDVWWREHRRAAPDLFTDELDRALLALGEMPTLGAMYQAGARTVRRLLLRRTHYQLYFVQETERVYVLAVWSAFRGRTPRL